VVYWNWYQLKYSGEEQEGDMERRRILVVSALLSGIATTLVLFVLVPGQATAAGSVHYVAPDCTDVPTPCYTTVQGAVDAARDGDVVKVASGTYTSVNTRPCRDDSTPGVITQVVYLEKSIAIKGGYTIANWTTPDPETNPTTLDAQGQGRVLYITGATVTIEGLRITGGDAQGLGSSLPSWTDAGGGVYVTTTTLTFIDNHVFGNTAECGGGMYLSRSDATLRDNTVTANTAGYSGGGLCMEYSYASFSDNTITANTAGYRGGGLHVSDSNATLHNNTVSDNTSMYGGGLYLYRSGAALSTNAITTNIAGYDGGGLYLEESEVTLDRNSITANTAMNGGGVRARRSVVALERNTILDNVAAGTNEWNGWGGGLCLEGSGATLSGNIIRHNTASQIGGGLYVNDSDVVASNNIIADNRAGATGSGLYITGSSTRLLHTTIARNGSTGIVAGSGVCITNDWSDYSTVDMVNTILVEHAIGITVAKGNKVVLEGTLWGSGDRANRSDWSGAGTIVTGTVNLWDDPGFVDPANGDYHIGAASPAADAGIDSGIPADVDGDPRPAGFGFDIGADERPGPSLHLYQDARPLISTPGQTVTYRLVVTSAGAAAVTHVQLTDTLPAFQQAADIVTDRGRCTVVAGWGGGAACDLGAMAPGQSARITLVAQVMTNPSVQISDPASNSVVVTVAETANSANLRIILNNCHVRLNDSPVEYPTIQAAVDASTRPADVVKVAGYCTGVTSRAGFRQVVYLGKTLTIQGGWNISFTQRSALDYPTTLDALGQGRVLYIHGHVSPTIEGLRMTGGNATGLGGFTEPRWHTHDVGGGAYVVSATVAFRDNHIFGNTAECGGGLFLHESDATLIGNTVSDNVASGTDDEVDRRGGGGLCSINSDVRLTGNTISANLAPKGGGVYSTGGGAALDGNTIRDNTAGSGGGVYLGYGGDARLRGNIIVTNAARGTGGGIYLNSAAVLARNVISANTATEGGGLYVTGNGAVLNGNTITSNAADDGGGIHLSYSDATLINNVVADNWAARAGSGLYIKQASPRLLHATIARNTGSSGVYVATADSWRSPSTVVLTDTILVGHEAGLVVMEGSTATLEATLWGSGAWANGADWAGVGTVSVGALNVWGDPGFVDPANGDYHIGAGSQAIDAGVASSALTDADGDPRPAGAGPDIGADERPGTNLYLHQAVQPSILSPGQPVTYTLFVYSGGANPATQVLLTDTLTSPQQATAVTTTRGHCTASADWGGEVVCDLGTLAPGDGVHITLVAWVTTTQPVQVGQQMQNAIQVTATETSNAARTHTLLHNCHARLNDSPVAYYTVQAAVDASTRPTDVVKVAGTCMDVTDRYDTLQIVHLSKTLTIQGGWNTEFTQRNVLSYPTTLDARGQGRVFFITGNIEPTVEGLTITGGDARQLGGFVSMWGNTYSVGGGVYVVNASPTFRDNRVFGNVASNGGGGFFLYESRGMLDGNTIVSNTSSEYGGGVHLHYSAATLKGNTVVSNTADGGGGVFLYSSDAVLQGNAVIANAAGRYGGGGLYLDSSHAALSSNTISANIADRGGGLCLHDSAATLANNVVAANQAKSEGSGVYIEGSSARLLHTTIARNTGGDGTGVYVTGYYGTFPYSTVWLTNTILVGHEIGLFVAEGNTVTLEATLWGSGVWANGTDWAGDGTIDIGMLNLWSDPAFVDPVRGDYHITAGSAAVDAGVPTSVATDIDGETRPCGAGPDLGADEWTGPLCRGADWRSALQVAPDLNDRQFCPPVGQERSHPVRRRHEKDLACPL
jgi:parallel beta-helix repeat protein